MAARDKRAATPHQATNYLKTMRGMFQWATSDEIGLLRIDPTIGVKGLKPARRSKDEIDEEEGYPAWTEEDVSLFEERWPIGTRERLAFSILIYTGLRRGDAARLGRQHIRNAVIHMRTEKTGMPVAIPILPELAEALATAPPRADSFVTTVRGRAMAKESFGNWFKKACVAAGVNEATAHGLRKIAAIRAALNGATVPQMNAIFGWAKGSSMAQKYIEAADRIRLAQAGISTMRKADIIAAL
ncbi:tyrosine-type recombinase/integrase [Methylocystis echinoides]|uniref:tyrosine-type recombinase/integrase n=1 Tax=Methylocystis echinoides TaxID=29468 RepID=UPI00343D7C30